MLKSSTLEGDEPRRYPDDERLVVRKKAHRFYFVKFRPYEDPQLKAKIAEAEKLISEIDQEKDQIFAKILERQNHKACAVRRFAYLSEQCSYLGGSWKREEMNNLQQALDRLSFANSAYQGKPTNLFLSDGEFDKHKLQFRMRHKTDNAAEERQIFREIKSSQRAAALKKAEIPYSSQLQQLRKRRSYLMRLFFHDEAAAKARDREVEELELAIEMEMAIEKEREREIASVTVGIGREMSIAFAAVKGKIWNSLGSKNDLKNRMKVVSTELDELRAKELEVKATIKRVKKEFNLEAIQKDVHKLEQKLKEADKRKDRLLEYVLKLRTQLSYDQKTCYGQCASLLASARKLAKIKDMEALAELSRKEVENFMSQWNTSEAFREDYEKRVSQSLESRELCKDGRRKNPGQEEENSS